MCMMDRDSIADLFLLEAERAAISRAAMWVANMCSVGGRYRYYVEAAAHAVEACAEAQMWHNAYLLRQIEKC